MIEDTTSETAATGIAEGETTARPLSYSGSELASRGLPLEALAKD